MKKKKEVSNEDLMKKIVELEEKIRTIGVSQPIIISQPICTHCHHHYCYPIQSYWQPLGIYQGTNQLIGQGYNALQSSTSPLNQLSGTIG